MSSPQIRVRLVKKNGPGLLWSSARLRFATLTDRSGLERLFDSVILVRAADRVIAFHHAIANGRTREQSYRNEAGVGVRWRLASVLSLDAIPEHDLNGTELLAG